MWQPVRSAFVRFASTNVAPLRRASLRFALLKFARAEVRLGKDLPSEVHFAEIGPNVMLLLPPSVPSIDALPEQFQVAFVGHRENHLQITEADGLHAMTRTDACVMRVESRRAASRLIARGCSDGLGARVASSPQATVGWP